VKRRCLSLQRALRGLKSFGCDIKGQITLSVALLVLPLVIATGSAIDYGLLVRAKSSLQLALDSATLAAAAKQGELSSDVARSYFELNGNLRGVTISKVGFEKQDDGTVAGSMTASVPAIFMKILRRKDYTIRLASTAKGTFPTYIGNLQLAANSAKGAYDKDVYYYARDASGKITNTSLQLFYDYNYTPDTGRWNASWGRSPGAPTFQWGKGESVGIMVVVYVDPSGRGERINPDVMTTDDADQYDFLKITGDCSDRGLVLSWEDTRDRYGDYEDFVMTLTCSIEKSGHVDVRLVK
jgi:Flp pilus assembly protein TadG